MPTLAEFASRFVDGHARANRQKPSSIHAIERALRAHLLPAFGSTRLDELSQEDIQQFKGQRSKLSPKTINNILSILRTALTAAVAWGVIERMPVEIKMMKVPKPSIEFFDFDEFDQLVASAETLDPRVLLAVLLGGEAGLRAGEIRALELEWGSIDLRRRMLTVERSEWEGHVTLPKHNKIRVVPMTERLTRALSAYRHLQGPRVLYRDSGEGCNSHTVRDWLTVACREAGLKFKSPLCLRHTFCSHLAMRGAPARSIQELAGHSDLKTTQRYMHLTPAALEGAIRLLEQPAPRFRGSVEHGLGDIVETV